MRRLVAAEADPDTGLLVAALIIDGTVEALEFDSPRETVRPGEIRRARVTGAISGVDDGVIVDLGDQEGFVSLRRRERLRSGQSVLVQIEVPPRDGKRARATTDLRLVGRTLIATASEAVSLSRSIADRTAAQSRAAAMGLDHGWILRGAFEEASDAEVEREAGALSRERACLIADGPPGRILSGPDALRRLWADWCDGSEAVVGPQDPSAPSWPAPLADREPLSLDDAVDIGEVLASERGREVALPSGGRITIERTRALIAIDVDAGRSGAMRANQEAIIVAARALRRRNLAGLIVIDPVSTSSGHAGDLIQCLRDATAGDARQIDIAPRSSRFGLIELTRARRGLALDEVMTMYNGEPTDSDSR